MLQESDSKYLSAELEIILKQCELDIRTSLLLFSSWGRRSTLVEGEVVRLFARKYPLRLKLLYEAKASVVATNAIIPRWPPNLGGQSLKGILYRTHVNIQMIVSPETSLLVSGDCS